MGWAGRTDAAGAGAWNRSSGASSSHTTRCMHRRPLHAEPSTACRALHCVQSPPLRAEPSAACRVIHCMQSLPAFQVQAKPAQEQQGVCNHVCFWNGGVGEAQLLWLRTVLSDARSRGQRALVFGHIPLLPAAGGANGRYAEPHHTIPCRMMSHIIPYPAVC